MEKRHADLYTAKSHWRKADEIRSLDYNGWNEGRCCTGICIVIG